jgi:16S rRNA (adenine1518-N6/adenine1519-N6)-dimethyltransferase
MNPRQILERYEVQPKKSLGQNFMHDPNMLDKIIATAGVTNQDTVLEIGPGTGTLTARLALVARQVIAVEVDERMYDILFDQFEKTSNVRLILQDILRTDLAAIIGDQPYVVVANVPYYITSAILQHLFESKRPPQRATIVMQYEVAERIIAEPKDGDMSLLAVSVQFYGQPRLVSRLNKALFWPRPEVDSALLRIDLYETPPVDVPSAKQFFRVVKAGFSQKRKQLRNAVSAGLHMESSQADVYLKAANIDPQRRAETVSLEEWAALTRVIMADQPQK